MKIFHKVIGFIIIILLLLAVAEVFLHIYYDNDPSRFNKNPYEDIVLTQPYNSPYVYIKRYGDMETYYVTQNNFLMRRRSDVSEKPEEGVVRILSYGDSVGLGVWHEDDENYSYFLDIKRESGR